MLDLLPEEIQREVFDFLSPKDLLNLTLTSKYFNELISTTSNLSNRIEIHFVSEHKNLTWTGSRNYSKVYLEGSPAKYFLPVFVKIQDNLREICIVCVQMDAKVLKKILIMCKNLKRIILKDNRISYTDEDFKQPLPKLHLESFQYRNFTDQRTKIFNFFMECKVRELIVLGFTASCEELRKFLRVQNGLKTFALHDADSRSSLFDEKEISDVKFGLKKLKIDSYTIGVENSKTRQNLLGFLWNHQQTLSHLELNDMNQEIFSFFLNFNNLKKLKVFDIKFEDFTPKLHQVTDLTIGYNVSGKWAEKFPNVKNLAMTWIQFKRDLIQVKELKKLEKLKISNCCIPEIFIANVKSLTLSDVGFAEEKPFNYSENKIEELFIENCSHIEWLMEFLSQADVKLNVLRISRTKMSENCEKFLDNCKSKIKSIQIVK